MPYIFKQEIVGTGGEILAPRAVRLRSSTPQTAGMEERVIGSAMAFSALYAQSPY